MVSVHNPVTFDDITLSNDWLAFLLGALCLMIVFRVLLPANPPREVRRLAASLGRAVEGLARLRERRLPNREAWQDLQMRKILRLVQRLEQVPEADAAGLLRAAFATVALGRTVLGLAQLRRDPALPVPVREAAGEALGALRRLRTDPRAMAGQLEAMGRRLVAAPTPDPPPPPLMIGLLGEAAMLIRQAGVLLDAHAALFRRGGALTAAASSAGASSATASSALAPAEPPPRC